MIGLCASSMISELQPADLATSTANQCERDEECKTWFSPPLYRQRYEKVYNILLTENVSSVGATLLSVVLLLFECIGPRVMFLMQNSASFSWYGFDRMLVFR